MENNELQALKTANSQRIQLLSKYLPDTKEVEVTGDPDNPLTTEIVLRVIKPES